jgi:hypothetical protein
MESDLLGWIDIAISTIGVAALGASLWQLFNLRRDISTMLRLVRRIDRKMGT